MQVTDTDIAWCAGLFDGEGHVSYSRNGPKGRYARVTRQLQCTVPQASDNIEVLEKFQRIVGLGTIKGPYTKGVKGKPKHLVSFKKHEVLDLYLALAPYLGRKKTSDFRQSLLAFENHNPNPTAEDYARLERLREKKQMKKLKR